MQVSDAMGVTVRAAALAVVLALIVPGCKDAKQTAEQTVQSEVEAAQRLAGKAAGLMAGGVYKVDGQLAPLTSPGRPRGAEISEVGPAAAMHPQAWQDLQAAERRLSDALRDYGQIAGDDSQALAYSTLGHVLIAKGRYQDYSSDANRREAAEAIDRAESACLVAGVWAGLLHRMDGGGSDLAAEARKMLSTANGDIEHLKEKIAQAAAQAASLRDKVQALGASNEEIIPKVRNLRVDIQLADARKGLELTDEVLTLEKEINDNASAIARLEGRIELGEAAWKEMEEARKEAETRASIASSILAQVQASSTRRAGQQGALLAELEKAKAQARQAAQHAVEACHGASATEEAAVAAYDQAEKALDRAGRLGGRSGRAAALSEQADALWAVANLQARRLGLHGRCVALANRLGAVWASQGPQGDTDEKASTRPVGQTAKPKYPPPDFATPLLDCLPNAEEVLQTAKDGLQQAADLYGQAADMTSSQTQWLYQGHQAAAYLALYRLTNRQDALTKARAVLAEALKDKRNSPYLTYLVDLETLAKSR